MDRKRILVVDKNSNTLFAFRLFLEQEGYNICESQSITDAKALLTRFEFLAAFIDLSVPQPIPPRIVSKMKDIANNLSLIIITSQPTQYLYFLVDHIGALDLLEKPISIINLRQVLTRILN